MSLEKFAKMATASYNNEIKRNNSGYLTMHPDIDGEWDGKEYEDWSMTDDATIAGGTSTKYKRVYFDEVIPYPPGEQVGTRVIATGSRSLN